MSNKKVTSKEVKHIAKLSKLEIEDDKIDYYANEMNNILEYFNVISKVDTSNVEPLTHITDNVNVIREDEPHDCIDKKKFIDNCPDTFGNYIKVPSILDKEIDE